MSALPKQLFELFHVGVSFTLVKETRRKRNNVFYRLSRAVVPKPQTDRPRRSNQTTAKQKPLQLPPQS